MLNHSMVSMLDGSYIELTARVPRYLHYLSNHPRKYISLPPSSWDDIRGRFLVKDGFRLETSRAMLCARYDKLSKQKKRKKPRNLSQMKKKLKHLYSGDGELQMNDLSVQNQLENGCHRGISCVETPLMLLLSPLVYSFPSIFWYGYDVNYIASNFPSSMN